MGARLGVTQIGETAVDGSGVAVGAIPLVVANEPAPLEPLPRRWRLPRFTVPRIVDYLIVAIFMFFVL